MKYLKDFKDYKGYLSGSLAHLHKHKSELEKEINGLEVKIGTQSHMNSLVPSRNKSLMINDWRKKLDGLKKELSEVDMEIKNITKSKLDD